MHAASIQQGTEHQGLRAFAGVADKRVWQIEPKVPKILPYPYLARGINPEALQNYGEEALIGTVTNTWKRSISGRLKKFMDTFSLSALSQCSCVLHFPLPHERSFSRWKS